IIVGAIFHNIDSGVANEFSCSEMIQSWNASTQFIPAIIYGMLGFELVSASSAEMKDPSHDVPRAIFISGLIIIVLYTLATAAILIANPGE
ncbi:MAG: amino acid permease, partial [Gammaproteobacteria bacterium]